MENSSFFDGIQDQDDQITKLVHFRIVANYISLILIVIGIIGNSFTFVVLLKSKKQLSTHIYLKSLCISAIISLIGLLINHALYGIFMNYNYNDGISLIIFIFPYTYPLIATFQICTIWLTVVVNLNHFVIIYRNSTNMLKLKKTFRKHKLIVLAVFLLSIVYCIPYWLKFKTEKDIDSNGLKLVPTELGKNSLFNNIVHFWMFLPFAYLIPFSILLITNIYLIYKLRQKISLFKGSSLNIARRLSTASSLSKQRKCSISELSFIKDEYKIKCTSIMLVAVVIFFLICQFPNLLIQIVESFDYHDLKKNIVYYYLIDLAKMCLIINLDFNFSIMILFSRSFQEKSIEI